MERDLRELKDIDYTSSYSEKKLKARRPPRWFYETGTTKTDKKLARELWAGMDLNMRKIARVRYDEKNSSSLL